MFTCHPTATTLSRRRCEMAILPFRLVPRSRWRRPRHLELSLSRWRTRFGSSKRAFVSSLAPALNCSLNTGDTGISSFPSSIQTIWQVSIWNIGAYQMRSRKPTSTKAYEDSTEDTSQEQWAWSKEPSSSWCTKRWRSASIEATTNPSTPVW